MNLYLFDVQRADGVSSTFLTYELSDDLDAGVRAMAIAQEHPSCSHVVVWCGDRKVLTRRRTNNAFGDVLRRTG